MKRNPDPLARLLARGERTETGCLVLPGKTTYSTVNVHGRTMKVHRFVYESAFGKTSDYVLHTCDNPPCFELSHLYAGTQSQNMLDMYERKRRTPTVFPPKDMHGSRNPNWKGGISLNNTLYARACRARKKKEEL